MFPRGIDSLLEDRWAQVVCLGVLAAAGIAVVSCVIVLSVKAFGLAWGSAFVGLLFTVGLISLAAVTKPM